MRKHNERITDHHNHLFDNCLPLDLRRHWYSMDKRMHRIPRNSRSILEHSNSGGLRIRRHKRAQRDLFKPLCNEPPKYPIRPDGRAWALSWHWYMVDCKACLSLRKVEKGAKKMSRFDYVKYDDKGVADQNEFKKAFEELESFTNARLKSPRAKALVLTKLEEAYMWVGKAIRDDQIERNGSAELQEDRKNG